MKCIKVAPVLAGVNTRNAFLMASWAASIALASSPCHAASGFTGNFAPAQNWVYRVQDSLADLPENCNTYPDEVQNCIEIQPVPGNVNLLQSNFDNYDKFSSWSWKNNFGTTYFVSFDYRLFSGGDGTKAYIRIGNPDTQSWTASMEIGGTSESYTFSEILTVQSEQTLVFSVTVPTNAPAGEFQINNFNAAVPTPLPAAGAASAFGFSRRLRRRIKGQGSSAGVPPVMPPHPSVYLNLAPAVLQAAPVSFSYASLPIRSERIKLSA